MKNMLARLRTILTLIRCSNNGDLINTIQLLSSHLFCIIDSRASHRAVAWFDCESPGPAFRRRTADVVVSTKTIRDAPRLVFGVSQRIGVILL